MGSLQFDVHDTCHVSKNINKTVLERGCRICCFFSLRTHKKDHSDRKAGNRKGKASTPQYMENEEQISVSFQGTSSPSGRSTAQAADQCNVWVPPQPVLKSSEGDKHSKAACRASAREDSSLEEENKALSHCLLSQVAQLTAHVSPVLPAGN